VPTVGEKVRFSYNAFGFQSSAQQQRVFNRHGVIILGMEQEMRRGIVGRIEMRRMGLLQRKAGVFAHQKGAASSMGIGESGNFPAAIKSVAEWFPQKERAFAIGLFNAGDIVFKRGKQSMWARMCIAIILCLQALPIVPKLALMCAIPLCNLHPLKAIGAAMGGLEHVTLLAFLPR
jgi:hypothetical protein